MKSQCWWSCSCGLLLIYASSVLNFAEARIWTIFPDESGDAPTIQAGIDSAAVGDTLDIAEGIYYEHNIFLNKDLVLRGVTGEFEDVIIDAQGLGQVFYCEYIETATCFMDLTLTGGFSGNGAGMECWVSSPTLFHCCFSDNEANGYGGGFRGLYSSPNFLNCTFDGNSANSGGGICILGEPYIEGCVFSRNVAGDEGGGIAFGTVGPTYPRLTNCTFYANEAVAGGGISCRWGQMPVLENSIIAFSEGGGAFSFDDSSGATLSCCDLYGNTGGDWVGTIADQYGFNGNISEDPLFCNAAGGDLRVETDSPCAPFTPPNTACDLIGAMPACALCDNEVPSLLSQGPVLTGIAPNPFSDRCQISFRIPGNGDSNRVRLLVYDPGGRMVRQILDTDHFPGTYTTTWDGTNEIGRRVVPGCYLYKLEWNGHTLTKRVILVR